MERYRSSPSASLNPELPHQLAEQNFYYDPFAEEGEELFSPLEALSAIEKEYLENRVVHDDSADIFVHKTEALMLDTAFVERFEALQAMTARIHQLCGEDHMLNEAVQSSNALSSFMDSHKADDGHGHGDSLQRKHNHKDDDEFEVDPNTGKKTKKKKRRGWLFLQ